MQPRWMQLQSRSREQLGVGVLLFAWRDES